MLTIYNSLSHQKEAFTPRIPGHVDMYVCGITVYDYCHLGHARVMASFDVITRYLRAQNYKVNYVRNITDIDDKIIARAIENNEDYQQLTKRFITAMHEDFTALGVLRPDQEPKATDYILEMIRLIQDLIKHDRAYVADNGDVYYAVKQFPHYGCLAHQDLEKLRSGARVAVTDAKQDPLDFVLWKLAKPGEPSWDSPWGQGRPGWHIECSAMSMALLGEQFDLHGGGMDLTFPHHENEIAQSEGATEKKFVNYWMHVGFLQINQEKMSKSLNNFFTIRDILAKHPAETLRYFLIASHYRSPLNYTDESLGQAHAALTRFYTALRGLDTHIKEVADQDYMARFNAAMDDDFNTPEALAVLFELVRDINKTRQENIARANELATLLKRLANILGLLQQNPEDFLQQGDTNFDEVAIQQMIKAREQARKEKNWLESDRLRDELLSKGIVLEDQANGTIWRRQ